MQLAARSALIASTCMILGAHALPASYSVVDVDGGSQTSPAAVAPTTIVQTVTESSDVKPAKPTTVSVTVIETPSSSPSTTPASTQEPASNALPSAPFPSSNASSPQLPAPSDVSSKTPFSSSSSSTTSSSSSWTTLTTPAAASISSAATTTSSNEITVTAMTTLLETETACPSGCTTFFATLQGSTITMINTVTATPSPSSTSYYDDGMWHTYYPIKPQESIFADYKQNAVASASPTASPQFNHSVSSLPSSTLAEVAPRQLATGVAAAVKPREAAAGTAADNYPRAEATGVVLEMRAAPTGVITEELVEREAEAGTIVAINQRAAATGAPIVERVAGTAAVLQQRAVATGILVDERAAPSAAPIAVRVAPAAYNVVSWNETTSA